MKDDGILFVLCCVVSTVSLTRLRHRSVSEAISSLLHSFLCARRCWCQMHSSHAAAAFPERGAVWTSTLEGAVLLHVHPWKRTWLDQTTTTDSRWQSTAGHDGPDVTTLVEKISMIVLLPYAPVSSGMVVAVERCGWNCGYQRGYAAIL